MDHIDEHLATAATSDADEPAVCLAPKIADLSEDRHAPTSRLLATAQV